MKTWIKMLLVTLLFGIPAIPLGQIIWSSPIDTHGTGPNGLQIALLIIISIVEALGFGFGIAFLMLGFTLIQRLAQESKGWTWAVYLCVAWALTSWWPHSNFHRVISGYDQLIALEYAFHISLIICAAVIALFFLRLLQTNQVNYRKTQQPETEKLSLTR